MANEHSNQWIIILYVFFVWLFCQSNCTNNTHFNQIGRPQCCSISSWWLDWYRVYSSSPASFDFFCLNSFCLFYDSAFNRFSSFDIGKLQKYGAFATITFIIYSNDGYCCGCGMIMLWWNCGSFVRFENNKMFMMSKYMIYTFTLH